MNREDYKLETKAKEKRLDRPVDDITRVTEQAEDKSGSEKGCSLFDDGKNKINETEESV